VFLASIVTGLRSIALKIKRCLQVHCAMDSVAQITNIFIGMTIVCATNEGLYARCSAWATGHLKFSSTSFTKVRRQVEIPLDIDELSKIALEGVSNQ
jgi:hypothetical protein